ncbi:MAG: hypothetical protein Q9180_009453, partial [Flavoplaca navasiana]
MIREEVRMQSSPTDANPKSAMREIPAVMSYRGILAMMISIDSDLLKAIITGQVPRKAQIPGSSVCNRLLKLDSRKAPPSIYMNAICDHEGISPTPHQWFKICHLMSRYMENSSDGNRFAMEIDQLIYPTEAWPITNHSFRRTLHRYTDKGSDVRCMKRRHIIEEFVMQMTVRLTTEEKQHAPLDAPVLEIGFSDDVRRRLRDHRQHKDSNYIMNLAEALFQYQYPDRFHLKQHVIYHCWAPDQPWPSEILLTRLAQGYTYGGGGFSHYGAGFSNGGAWCRRTMKDWAIFDLNMHSDADFQLRLQAVEQRAETQLERQQTKERNSEWLVSFYSATAEALMGIEEFAIARKS